MIDTDAIRKKILELIVSGQLVEQRKSEGTAQDIFSIIEKEGYTFTEPKDYVSYDIPDSWQYVSLSSIAKVKGGKRIPAGRHLITEANEHKYIRVSDMHNGTVNEDDIRYVPEDIYPSIKQYFISSDDVYITVAGTIGRVGLVPESLNGANLTENADKLVLSSQIEKKWLMYVLMSDYLQKQISYSTTQVSQPKLAIKRIEALAIPLCPLAEQQRIVERVESIFSLLDEIDEAQKEYADNLDSLKSKLIDLAIQGKITSHDINDDVLPNILVEDDCIEADEKEFNIPDNWKWIRLGWIMDIDRGGSPRPIKAFLTKDENGINWIKIGDVSKDGKYIESTAEKIKPEGEKKSRKVYPGDFLLTNSMSFGKPYITKIEGCVHDGWLILRNSKELFDLEFLYYLLSSSYVYRQFCQKASGATVDNLNKEKVAAAVIPLPPIAEQKRIVERLKELLPLCS